jgi:hypothetical protein
VFPSNELHSKFPVPVLKKKRFVQVFLVGIVPSRSKTTELILLLLLLLIILILLLLLLKAIPVTGRGGL